MSAYAWRLYEILCGAVVIFAAVGAAWILNLRPIINGLIDLSRFWRNFRQVSRSRPPNPALKEAYGAYQLLSFVDTVRTITGASSKLR